MGSADLRKYCRPIRDQANCGSCTAFGMCGAWTTNLKSLKGIDVDLSERHLFFCSGGGCKVGNTLYRTLSRAMVGVALDECLPYGSTANGTDYSCGEGMLCADWWTHGKKIKSYVVVDAIGAKKALDEKRALVCTMLVYQSFMNYVSGVYRKLSTLDPYLGGHMMCIVGYDDAKGAWLVRNSWGTGWGEQGYAWVGYNECGIENIIIDFVLDDALPEPEPSPYDPEPKPTPSSCAHGRAWAKIFNFVPWLLRRKGRFMYMDIENKKPNKKCKCCD